MKKLRCEISTVNEIMAMKPPTPCAPPTVAERGWCESFWAANTQWRLGLRWMYYNAELYLWSAQHTYNIMNWDYDIKE